MKHIEFFYAIISFAVGFGTLITYTMITFRTRDKILLHILAFYCVLSAQLFLNIIFYYIYENYTEIFIERIALFSAIISISYSLMVFTAPFFISYLVNFPYKKAGTAVYALISLIYFPLSHFLYENILVDGHLQVRSLLPAWLDVILFYAIVFYTIGLGLLRLPKITDLQVRKLVRNFCITTAVFVPGLLAEVFFPEMLPLPLTPALYCIYCILFILFLINVYLRDYYISSSEVDVLVVPDNHETDEGIFKQYNISEREIDIIRLLLKGYSNKKIADELFISLSTVKTHIYKIYKKIRVSNRYELIHLIKFQQEKSVSRESSEE